MDNESQTEPPDEKLNRLLNAIPRQEPPAWFEAKVLARIRREQEHPRSHSFLPKGKTLRWIAGGALTITLLLLGTFHFTSPSHPPVPAFEDQEIFAALDTFRDYSEENLLWSDDLL